MDSPDTEENKFGAHVLYELLVYKEWELNREKYKKVSKDSLIDSSKPKNFWLGFLWSIFNHIPWPEEDLARAGSLLLPWQLSVSPNGNIVTILEDSVLELRQSKDEYTTVAGRAAVPKDDRPQLRKVSWSPDSNMVAVASSDGSVRIFDCFGSLIFKIPLLTPEKPLKKLIVGLEFIFSREKKGEWELLIIYANGALECYSISSLDKCTLSHTTSLSENGISCTYFSAEFSILFASFKPLNLPTGESKTFFTGITAWRLLNESPYYERVFPINDDLSLSKLHGKMWNLFSLFSSSDCICKIVMAPNNQHLATLHSCGIVFIWQAPSLRLLSTLDKFDFKKQKVLVSLSEAGVCSHVIDIEWRKDSKLIVAWRNGTISIHDVQTHVVLAYFGPDFLHSLPRLGSASTLHGFLALECENENASASSVTYSPGSDKGDVSLNENRIKPDDSISNSGESKLFRAGSELFSFAMYILTDLERFEPKRESPKFIKKTYRLLGVKMTTPEELFERYLKNEEFDRAFEICTEYGLDVAKVYMRQWRTSDVNEHSIQEYLANVEDDEWVINECLECIPETLSGAKKLLEFGLNFTNIKSILDAEATSELTDKQKLFVSARLRLLNYARKLQTYELIFNEDSYNPKSFEKLRNQSIVSSAIDFARSAQTEAVKILLTYHGQEVLPYWLNILDNYPESLRPRSYSDILPECDGDLVPVKWQCIDSVELNDWAFLEYSSQFPDISNEENNYSFPEIYHFDRPTLSEWYKKRAIALEELSTIVENAVELLELGTERNIEGLEGLLFVFRMLSTLVYDLGVSVTYYSFQSREMSEKLQLFIQEPEEFCDTTLEWIHPYLEQFTSKNSKEWQILYKDFIINNSKRIFGDVIEYFFHILRGNLHVVGSPYVFLEVLVESVYTYDKLDQLKKTEDLIAESITWLSSLSGESRKADLLEKLFTIQNELTAINILMKYGFLYSISSIHKLKLDKEESKNFIETFSHTCLESFGNNINDWEECLLDLVDLERYCFTSVPLQFIYKIYVSRMLRSGFSELIEYTPTLLCVSKSSEEDYLNFETSVQIVLEAAEHYFNDDSMALAKMCLLLIADDHPTIQEELDLINSVKLLQDMGINILPIQVRKTTNKMKLIELCFEKNSTAYQSPQLVYKLASKLHIFNSLIPGDECSVTLCLAEEAFKRKDFSKCAEFCSDLILSQYPPGWKICMKLANSEKYYDIPFKNKIISFSMLHAPSRTLPQILNIRHRFETQDIFNTLLNETIVYLRGCEPSENISGAIQTLEYYYVSRLTHELLNDFIDLCDKVDLLPHLTSGVSKNFSIVRSTSHIPAAGEICDDSFVSISLSNELEFLNKILKLMLSSSGPRSDSRFFSTVLTGCSILSSSYDTTLCLCYLLCLKNPKDSSHFFKFFEESSLLYQFQCYYLGLKNSIFESTDWNLRSSHEVVSSLLKEGANPDCSQIFKEIQDSLKCFEEASQVISHEAGIDVGRFKADEKYKNDTIFGLALNEDLKSLSLALDLARKNNISLHEVVISHMISLLINNSSSTALERISDENVLSTLKGKEDESISKLMDTFYGLNGTNYQQLIIFFNYIKSIKSDYLVYGLAAKDHLSLLKKIKSLPKGINYKDLILSEKKICITLKPIMNEENFYLIAKFLKSLPASLVPKNEIGEFFLLWATEEFFKRCTVSSFKQCILNFESLYKFFSKLSSAELRQFVENTLLTREVAMQIESGLRKQLITLLSDWCETNNSSDQFTDLLTFLQANLDLLNKTWDDEYDYNDSSGLKKYIFSIEEAKRNGIENISLLLEEALNDSSLNRNDLIYLHELCEIDLPLSFNEEPENYTSPKDTAGDPPEVNRKDTRKQDHISSLKSHFPQEIFLGVNFDNAEECVALCLKLIATSKKMEHLVMIHGFMKILPHPELCQNKEISREMLKTALKFSSDAENLYLFVKNTLEKTISSEVAEELLEGFKKEGSQQKLFIIWLCLLTDPETFAANVVKLINDGGNDLINDFNNLPKFVAEDILPHIIHTSFYKKLIDFIFENENTQFLTVCIEALEKSDKFSSSHLKTEVAVLKLHLNRHRNYREGTPSSLMSFYSILDS